MLLNGGPCTLLTSHCCFFGADIIGQCPCYLPVCVCVCDERGEASWLVQSGPENVTVGVASLPV